MKKIINIAINPCGIGGAETFSRILNKQFPQSKTFSFRHLKNPIYKAKYSIINKNKIKRILKNIPFLKIKYLYNLPKAKNKIIILNALCDLDNIPSTYLKENEVIFISHFKPKHIDSHKNYLGYNRKDRIRKIKYFNLIVCLSKDYISNFSSMFQFSKDKIYTINHTVEIYPLENPKSFEPNIITICRLNNKLKRLDRFIKVANKNKNLNFIIYGDGPDKEKINELAKNIKNISLYGPTNNIKKAHQDAGIFLMTSDVEAYPISIIESLSQGTPVIIAKNSFANAKKLIKNNYNGFVCEKFNIDEIYEKIGIIKSDYKKFSTNAIKSFEGFNQDNFKKEWNFLFKQLDNK